MNIVINILWILLWNLLVPILIGNLFTKYMKQEMKDNIALNFTIGLIAMLGIFQPITLVAVYFKTSFTLLTEIMSVVWGVLSIISVMLNWKRFIQAFGKIAITLKKFNVFLAIALFLISMQAYAYVGYMHFDDDDAFFVATATTAIANDNLYIQDPYTGVAYASLPTRYILSPFSIYYAVMSELTDMHPTIYAHLYLPVVLLLFVYLLYYLWGKEWFVQSKSLGMFLILISFLNIFGNYSDYTMQNFLLSRLWQGKAFLAAGIVPFMLYICYKISKEDRRHILWFILLLSASAASHVSSMGIFLAPISIGSWALVDIIRTRKIKKFVLYIMCCMPCVLCGVVYMLIR